MSRKDELLALAERVEGLTGPDRGVDAAIAVAMFGGTTAIPLGCYWTGGEYYHATSAAAYTASLDAAMSLVPEGWAYATGNGHQGAWAWCQPDDSRTWVAPEDLSKAATPALALTAAALRAIAKIEGEQP